MLDWKPVEMRYKRVGKGIEFHDRVLLMSLTGHEGFDFSTRMHDLDYDPNNIQ